MNRSIRKNDDVLVWSYIRKKFSKIIPMFLFTTLSTLVIREMFSHSSLKEIVLAIFRNFFEIIFLRMAGWAEEFYINPVTWYLSAIFLAILLLYPVALKCRKACADYVFPIITIALVSYLVKEYGTVVTVSTEYSYFSLDLVKRAIAEICFGFSMYELASYISSMNFSNIGKKLLCIIEFLGYASVIFAALFSLDADYSVWIVFFLGISIAISFSGAGISFTILRNSLRAFLSEFALSLYLSHYEIIILLLNIKDYFQEKECAIVIIYILLSTIISIMNVLLVRKLKKAYMCLKDKIVLT